MGMVLMDNEFEKLQNLVPIVINTTAAKEHIPEVECKIRLIKERGRGILNILPFNKMPRLMLIELLYHVVLWLNAFPANSGVSETLSPRKIVYRHKLDFANCKSPFRTYCKVHDANKHHGDSLHPGNSAQPHWKLARDLQVSQPDWQLERRSSNMRSRRTPCRTRSSRRSKRMASRPPCILFE